MSKLEILKSLWSPASDWAMSASCMAAAERIFPVIDRLACDRTRNTARRILDDLWTSCDGKPSTKEEFTPQLKSLEELPESSEELDSHEPNDYAAKALGVLWHAVRSKHLAVTKEALNSSISSMLSLCADFDYLIGMAGKRNTALEDLEVGYQQEAFRLLQSCHDPNSEVITSLRQKSIEMSETYRAAVASARLRTDQ